MSQQLSATNFYVQIVLIVSGRFPRSDLITRIRDVTTITVRDRNTGKDTTKSAKHGSLHWGCRATDAGVVNASQITSSSSGVGLTVYLHSGGSRP